MRPFFQMWEVLSLRTGVPRQTQTGSRETNQVYHHGTGRRPVRANMVPAMVVANGDHMDCLNSVLGVNRFVVVLHTARRNTGLNTTCCVTPYRYSARRDTGLNIVCCVKPYRYSAGRDTGLNIMCCVKPYRYFARRDTGLNITCSVKPYRYSAKRDTGLYITCCVKPYTPPEATVKREGPR